MSTISVDLGPEIFSTHNFDAPATTVETDKEELMRFLREMYTMRRMEITNDTEYKVGGSGLSFFFRGKTDGNLSNNVLPFVTFFRPSETLTLSFFFATVLLNKPEI